MTTDRRTRHRPTDPALLRRAALELMLRGLSLQDAAAAIGMTPQALNQLLDIEEPIHAPD